ncbi:sucrose phosphorylase [Pseudobutyrivibrio sp. OR37]|uniref:glycosidase n=1 Tax=Pseudobutyrivibrio sp. OR37 TaxID=1798186 RepID=UPI0008F017ED|nr:glycosidase [Pseudobutyrivibrio sp. OR37]SFH54577.1 sucrose phosphorylase [Pseudobutyrivibrio sp. OR37]
MSNTRTDNGPMLNAYPDSMGANLSDIISVLSKPEFKDTFQSFYILPSIYNTDLDRGFSVIDYGLNKELVASDDLSHLEDLGIDLKLDFILNHASVLSPQFQDLIKNGEKSKYADFFINWNKFWDGYGEMTEGGYIQPDEKYIKDMFFRKPGLPILMVRMPDGKDVPYWNTFYQEVRYLKPDVMDLMDVAEVQYSTAVKLSHIISDAIDAKVAPKDIDFKELSKYKDVIVDYLESNRRYLGQMDLNIKSDLVWEHYDNTLKTLSNYGAKIVRLDAFAYAPKEPGKKNFLNEPDTWDVLEKVKQLADKYNLSLLPEIHASYGEGNYETIASKGYMTYDFFLPGLLIYTLERQSADLLVKWAKELVDKNIRVVNMLGCHDGIPLLDLKGMLPENDIQDLIDTIVGRGGYVKDLHGAKNMYYQVNATYYSALGEDDKKMLLARAIQMFMPGKPQVWYLDLFVGKNDHEAVKRAGEGGHKEINRTNLSMADIEESLKKDVVKKQLELLRLRNTHPAFGFDSNFTANSDGTNLTLGWEKDGHAIKLIANLEDYSFEIKEN